MRKRFTLLFLIVTSTFLSCNFEFGNSFKIMNDLTNKFDFNLVSRSWDDQSAVFTLQDIDHDNLSIENLQSYSIIVDEYLTNKYPRIDNLKVRKYLFSGTEGSEIVEFTLDENGNLTTIKKY